MAARVPKHYARIIAQWPKDPLRPNTSFNSLLQARLTAFESAGKEQQSQAQAELRNINALYSLLDDRYLKKYPVTQKLTRPESNPDYYDNLWFELQEIPNRSFLDNMWRKLKGKVRMQ